MTKVYFILEDRTSLIPTDKYNWLVQQIGDYIENESSLWLYGIDMSDINSMYIRAFIKFKREDDAIAFKLKFQL